jgi:hypothetical protein
MDDFLKSDYCTECDGLGYYEEYSQQTAYLVTSMKYQCPSCEELHQKEARADILEDELKND